MSAAFIWRCNACLPPSAILASCSRCLLNWPILCCLKCDIVLQSWFQLLFFRIFIWTSHCAVVLLQWHSTCENFNCTNLFFPALIFLDCTLEAKFFKVHRKKSYSCSNIRHFHLTCFLCFLPIAKSDQNNQSKKFGLLSQLALSSQTKFFLKSPPKFRKKTEADQFAALPDADRAAELDDEADTCESQSLNEQYEDCLSAGLDCAISELVSLDSQAEVDQGIWLWEGTHEHHSGLQASMLFLIQGVFVLTFIPN